MGGEDEAEVNAELVGVVVAHRVRFASFYGHATDEEALLFDSLALGRHMLVIGLDASGSAVPERERSRFERENIAVEQLFTNLREKVRASTAFQSCSEVDRLFIERDIFELPPPQ